MIGTGLKYVHAINRGQQGKVGDLERSQKMIADSYRSHEENQMQLQEVGQKAFDEWTMLKENRDIAARSLSLLKPPEIETVLSEMDEMVQVSPHCNLTPRDLKYVVQVGVLLKKVDRSLFSDWYKWANTNSSADRENLRKSISASLSKKPSSELPCAISYFFGIAIWDYLEPTCCDVHSSMNSQVVRFLPSLLYVFLFTCHTDCRSAILSCVCSNRVLTTKPPFATTRRGSTSAWWRKASSTTATTGTTSSTRFHYRATR